MPSGWSGMFTTMLSRIAIVSGADWTRPTQLGARPIDRTTGRSQKDHETIQLLRPVQAHLSRA